VIRTHRGEAGQAALLFLGVLAALLAGTLVLFGFGQALGTRSKHQRAADLAAVTAAQVMRDNYARLFQPPLLRAGVPNPRHLTTPAYLAVARAAAVRGARRNGLPSAFLEGSPAGAQRAAQVAVSFPGGGFAPTRVAVAIRGGGEVRVAAGRTEHIDVEARATAELVPNGDFGLLGLADGGGYGGPFAHRQGERMRPDVALAFDRMAAAARREAGLYLSITSGYRSDAEQAVLWEANPDPRWVAPPGTSLHRYGT
jgi:D-alanyl-D-alanine carboxypeptidase/Putative Flp pilus-assembly TadE/G-like